MGTMLRVECDACLYSEEVLAGAGMAGACYEPALCRPCQRVVSAQVTATMEEARRWAAGEEKPPHAKQASLVEGAWPALEPRCPECGGVVEKWGAIDEDDRAEPGPCPECDAQATVEDVGIWD